MYPKTVQLELYQTPIDTSVFLLYNPCCIGLWLSIDHCLKQSQLFTSVFALVYKCPHILFHIFLLTVVLTVSGKVWLVEISLLF